MSTNTRKIVAVLSASALLGGAGLGVAQAAKGGNGNGKARAERAGGRHHGPLPQGALQKIASTLGVSTADLRAALEANRPAAPPAGERRGPEQLAADLASALGVETAKVTEILEANKPARPAGRPARGTMPPKPDHTKLIAALASGLNLDEATVKAAFDKIEAAHQAEHQARETAMYEAVAKALGKTTDEVKAAFEANRPAKPAR